MPRFNFTPTTLKGLLKVERRAIDDHRGFLSRLYCTDEFSNAGINKPIVQINHALTREKGTVRGMHFQYAPFMETKLVSCIKGKIFDVAVDLRRNSATYLHHHTEILSAENRTSLFIPEGFAHGFQALTADCELIYLHSESYHPEAEGILNVTDPALNISWILPIRSLSDRDKHRPFIDGQFQGATA